MTSQDSHLKYRPDIDGLRAIAVLSVVCFHAFPGLLPGGFIGVDIFFVISGYLITSILLNDFDEKSFSFKAFYSRRIRRIFPALLLVLMTTFGLGWILLPVGEFAQLGKHILGGSSFLSNLFIWNESGYFDRLADTKPLLHLWSLGIEEQFYIFWPILLLAAYKLRVDCLRLILALFLISFSYGLLLLNGNSIAAFFSPLSRMWELLIGSFIAYCCIYRKKLVADIRYRYGNILTTLGFVFICIGLALLSPQSLFPGAWAMLPTVGAAFIILAGQNAWFNRRILALPLFVWFGLISYPLYLWHWPVLTFFRITSLEEINSLTYLLLIAISIFLAYFTFLFVEKPLRKKIATIYSVPALIMGVLLMGFLGFNTYQREGLPSRKIAREAPDAHLSNSFGQSGCFNVLNSAGQAVCEDVKYPIMPEARKVPVVFLWGDSHAGHLNAGLLLQAGKLGFSLYDDSMPACPPILNFAPRGDKSGALDENQKCIDHNLNAVKAIKEIRPKVVILAANWMQYDGVHQFNLLPYSELLKTITVLRSFGVESIMLSGNAPVFYVDQSKLASKLFKVGQENRTYKRFDYRSYEADQAISNFAKKNGVEFFSPAELLCNDQGCLMSTSSNFLTPVAVDTSHFSKEGSQFFVQMLVDQHLFNLK